ncbi:aspartate kinase [Hutsoniella sourekii]|uniref:aspartate kinase n=1 Tax=Hutsoniella sourekii TaxID=87650 RepID=UPI000480D883|nr:aspartate kinase [Hutsoniella sourekii]
MKVAKFGGSSLCDAKQIQAVATIIKDNPDIKAVVVSAPGKRYEEDTKVTDLLIALYTDHIAGIDTSDNKQAILKRYQSIIDDLELDHSLLEQFEASLDYYLEHVSDPDHLSDALKSRGEDFNAQLISQYFTKIGIPSKYLSPKDAGIIVSDQPGNARLLEESYLKIANIRNMEETIIIPGFFGVTNDDQIVTFSRGGSDITGAIIARGINADLYENYTDVSYIYSAHPGIVKRPNPIKQLTYREMRELSYSGFSVFHDEALEPLYQVKIPVMIKNTNDPQSGGTMIVNDRDDIDTLPVIGIAGDDGFMSVTLKRYLLNREIGYARRLLQIFEDHQVNIEHMPTGIDDISVILRSDQLEGNNKLDLILEDIQAQLDPEWIHVQEDLAIVAIVGEGMRDYIGLANRATKAFRDADVSLQMINQGASEISMFFAIPATSLNDSLKELYYQYFI